MARVQCSLLGSLNNPTCDYDDEWTS